VVGRGKGAERSSIKAMVVLPLRDSTIYFTLVL